MGICASNPAKNRSKEIDVGLQEEARKLKNECKILLLGAGESGKSTIVKQMKIIHHNGFSDQERKEFVGIVKGNLVDSLKVVLHILDEAERKPDGVPSGVDWQSGKWFVERALASSYLSHFTDATSSSSATCVEAPNPSLGEEDQPDQIGHAVEKIWLDPAVQRLVEAMCSTYTSASGLQLMDNASFFLSAASRILLPSYLPEAQDILLSRARSFEVKETRFTMGTLSIHLFDVGGQRSERRKWIHCFGGVTSIIFCTALSEYDQVLEEDTSQNRMNESLDLFKSVIRSQWFIRTSIILFLNKADVFKKKLPKVPLNAFFPEYIGGDDVKKGVKFIWWKYMQTVKQYDKGRVVYPHVTQATDTNTIHKVFLAVKETILQKNLHESGIL